MSVNKYFLFSYTDSKNKVRCLTIFTLYNMIQTNSYVHPITLEPLSESDITRAKQLIELYSTKIGLFKDTDIMVSPEYKLRNRITQLYKKFHIHSIYLDESWIMSINNKNDLYQIIDRTAELVHENIRDINAANPDSKYSDLNLFKKSKKNRSTKITPKKPSKSGKNGQIVYIKLKEYIVSQWEKLIDITNNPQNQVPIWIIIVGMSFVVPEIKQKYPDLEIMLQG